jgi:hypothetical protein
LKERSKELFSLGAGAGWATGRAGWSAKHREKSFGSFLQKRTSFLQQIDPNRRSHTSPAGYRNFIAPAHGAEK